jgi:hypothetical protein
MIGCKRQSVRADLECVKAILRQWDPIGVFPDCGSCPARDEYDSYAPHLLSLICSGAADDVLAQELETIRTVRMGLPRSLHRDKEIAEQLSELRCAGDDSLPLDGYALETIAIPEDTCAHLINELPKADARTGGVRNLLANVAVREFVASEQIARILAEHFQGDVYAVKATLFDKRRGSNWNVPWHQDRIVSVSRRVDAFGFSRWTVKGGIVHVEPPLPVLQSMMALRVHLDDCMENQGALRVVPGSHRLGKLLESELAVIVRGTVSTSVPVVKGQVITMKPLLIHASSASEHPAHRRVLHIEFAPREVIAPADWADAVPVLGRAN